ncbi:glycosyltransferase family 4 protein [Robertmurraya sp. GLU-23]
MKFLLFFPGIEKLHEAKDVGMFPRELAKKGFHVTIVTDEKRDFGDFEGVSLHELNKSGWKLYVGFIIYLFRNRDQYDVFQLFHFSKVAALLAFLFKLFNSKGITYLKMDADYRNLELWNKNTSKWYGKLQYFLSMKYFDLMTIETESMFNGIMKVWPFLQGKLKYLPNGLSFSSQESTNEILEVKPTFLTVGRIGTYQKATDILVHAFAQIADQTDFTLKLVGPVENSFHKWLLDQHLSEEITNRIHLTGNISERELLKTVYQESAIFVFPSRWESSGLALIEAAGEGNYIIGTDVGATGEVVNQTKFGSIVEIDDVEGLSNALLRASKNKIVFDLEKRERAKSVVRRSYDYSQITDRLISYITDKINKRK